MFHIIGKVSCLGSWKIGAGVSAVVEYSHQRSYKVIIQGHVTKKGDLTKNFDQVCV